MTQNDSVYLYVNTRKSQIRFIKTYKTITDSNELDQVLEFDINLIAKAKDIKSKDDYFVIKIIDFDDFVNKLSKSQHTVEMQWHLTKKNKESFLKITLQKGEESKISSTCWTAIELVKEPIKSELNFNVGKMLCFIADLTGPKNIFMDSSKLDKDIKLIYLINPRNKIKIDLQVSLNDSHLY